MKHRVGGPRFRTLRDVSFLEKETGLLIFVFTNGAQPPFQSILSDMSIQASFCAQRAGSVWMRQVLGSTVLWPLPRGEATSWDNDQGLGSSAPTQDTIARRVTNGTYN